MPFHIPEQETLDRDELARLQQQKLAVVLEEVRKHDDDYGYDAEIGEYAPMLKAGIVDPVKVTRSALQNAASVAAMVLTTESMITEIPEKAGAAAPPMPPMDY